MKKRASLSRQNEDDNADVDMLNIQIEDCRLKLFEEIRQMVQKQTKLEGNESRSIELSLSNEGNPKNYERSFASICSYLKELNIDFQLQILGTLSKQEKRLLEEKVFKYKDIIGKQSQFQLIENLDNEEESDYGDESLQSENRSEEGPESMYSPSLRDISKPQSKRGTKNKMVVASSQPLRKKSFGSIRSIRSDKKSKKFLMQLDHGSQRSGSSFGDSSLYRRDRLNGLESDYHVYLQSQQGIFTVRCQMMSTEVQKLRHKVDVEKLMTEFPNFKKLQKEIEQDDVYRGLQTVVIDIENTLVTLIDIRNKQEFDQIKQNKNFESDFIVV